MTELSLDGCRKLIGVAGEDLSDEQVLELRNSLVALAGVIVDAYLDLANIDQSTFTVQSDVIDELNADAMLHTHGSTVIQ